MYDYISIYSDDNYSKTAEAAKVENYFVNVLHFTRDSHLKFSKDLHGQKIRITGIMANSRGNYAFYTLEGVEEINLLEINLPWHIDHELEKSILEMASAIAEHFSWQVDLRE